MTFSFISFITQNISVHKLKQCGFNCENSHLTKWLLFIKKIFRTWWNKRNRKTSLFLLPLKHLELNYDFKSFCCYCSKTHFVYVGGFFVENKSKKEFFCSFRLLMFRHPGELILPTVTLHLHRFMAFCSLSSTSHSHMLDGCFRGKFFCTLVI
jgi:hypothetical protein